MNGALGAVRDGVPGVLAAYLGWLRSHRATLPLAAGRYTRTLVHAGDGFEIVAMQWAPGSKSPVHDHWTSRCASLVVEGELLVERYVCDPAPRLTLTRRFAPGEVEALDDARDLHRVANDGSVPSVSLHLYAGPLRRYRSYDLASGRVETHSSRFEADLSGARSV